MFLSSADWMPRNMDRRIELLIPIFEPAIKNRIKNEILATTWNDNYKARKLNSDGTYSLRKPEEGGESIHSQQRFIELARQGGIQSMPYEIAIRHKPQSKEGLRPIAGRRKERKNEKMAGKK